MQRRPAFLACAFVLGCADVGGNFARATSTGTLTSSGPAGSSGAGAGTTSSGDGAASSSGPGAGPSGSGAGTTGPSSSGSSTGGPSSSGSGNAASSSSGNGGASGSGGGGTGGSIYDTPPTCSSMTTALPGNGADMQPGAACASCHVLFGQASGHTFDVAGTVYLTAHEPDGCNGVNVSGAVVIITDATNTDTSLPVNSAGNFYHDDLLGFAAFKTPLKARVQYNGNTRVMLTPLTTGDCNSCHTETGTQSAPGRIMLP
jgi:hypothetical protein